MIGSSSRRYLKVSLSSELVLSLKSLCNSLYVTDFQDGTYLLDWDPADPSSVQMLVALELVDPPSFPLYCSEGGYDSLPVEVPLSFN